MTGPHALAASRPAWCEVDLDAIAANVATLAARAPGADLCAVVKADAYGHGAVRVARTAVAAGARWLGVATAVEAWHLVTGIDEVDVPVLVLSEPDVAALESALDDLGPDAAVFVDRIRPTVSSRAAVEALAASGRRWRVHVKVDTGMHRVGVDPADAATLVAAVRGSAGLELEGLWTHFAVADEPDDPFTGEQLDRFRRVLDELDTVGGRPPVVHVANSAATLTRPDTHADLVRCGIALYGVPPAPALAGSAPLRPALRLVARVREVRRVEAGETVSYGRRWTAHTPARVATIPVGYADGLRRSASLHGVEVLVRGRRCPLVGAVTMDQAMVAVPDDVSVGDEVVLIGRQGDREITATEVAGRLGTIAYEILTDLGPRLPRVEVGGGRRR